MPPWCYALRPHAIATGGQRLRPRVARTEGSIPPHVGHTRGAGLERAPWEQLLSKSENGLKQKSAECKGKAEDNRLEEAHLLLLRRRVARVDDWWRVLQTASRACKLFHSMARSL